MANSDNINWYSNDVATFGDRIAAAREARRLTAKSLAKRLGVAAKTVDSWENDLSEPRANKLQMLSGVLNVSIPWLLTGEGDGIESDAAMPGEVTELLTELRTLRAEIMGAAERLGVLEKRLKKTAA